MGPEEALQRAVCDLLRLHEKRGDLVYCHVPNGGLRNKITAGILKGLGVQAGVPDLLIWLPGGKTLAIELKSQHGYLSPSQHAWHAAMAKFGHRVSVCRSLEEVQAALGASGVVPIGRIARRDGYPAGPLRADVIERLDKAVPPGGEPLP